MADTAQFTIGTGVSRSDGPVGRVSRVIVDPVAEKVNVHGQDMPEIRNWTWGGHGESPAAETTGRI